MITIRHQRTLLIIAAGVALAAAGCIPQSKHLLPNKFAVEKPNVVGEFYYVDKKGRHEVSITHDAEAELPYLLALPESKPRFKVFQVGDLLLAFAKVNKESGYAITRVSVTDKKIVAEVMQNEYFEKHPDVLPSVEIERGIFTTANIGADSKQLATFFKEHGDDEGLFHTENPLILHRVKKD